jgi:hypothetical protein
MTRRWRLWLTLGLLLLLGSLALVPSVRWRVVGWVRGEAFYQGRPTTYWRRQVERLDQGMPHNKSAARPSRSLLDEILDLGDSTPTNHTPAVLSLDQGKSITIRNSNEIKELRRSYNVLMKVATTDIVSTYGT